MAVAGEVMDMGRSGRCFLFLLVTFAVLAYRPATSVPATPPREYKIQDVSMTLRRTSCYGECPVYSVTIRGSGEGIYDGKMWVKTKGKRAFQLNRNAVVELYSEFVGIEFTSMHDSYNQRPSVLVDPDGTVKMGMGFVADSPGLVLVLQIGNDTKTITADVMFAPKDLLDLAAKIDHAANTDEWIREQPIPAK